VRLKRKIPKDDTQARIILFQELLNKAGEASAGWTLKIAKLLQSHRSIGVAPNVHWFGDVRSWNTPVFRDRQELCTLRSIEHCSAPDVDQCDRNNNYKRQISFHRVEEERKTSVQRSNRQVITRMSNNGLRRLYGYGWVRMRPQHLALRLPAVAGKCWTRERFRSWQCEASSHRFSINGLLPQKATREHVRTPKVAPTAGRNITVENLRRQRGASSFGFRHSTFVLRHC